MSPTKFICVTVDGTKKTVTKERISYFALDEKKCKPFVCKITFADPAEYNGEMVSWMQEEGVTVYRFALDSDGNVCYCDEKSAGGYTSFVGDENNTDNEAGFDITRSALNVD